MLTRLCSVWVFLLLTLVASPVWASGPRWVGGPPFYIPNGYPVIFSTNTPLYYTDPGDLGPTVNHAAADALVSRAASVWNVPMASLVLSQGGTLNEHVSSANVTVTSSGLVFPADVQASNSANKQIAVIYDTDGSVTEMLLGGGSSDPALCQQNAVTDSVDLITPDSKIQHATLIVNGRCTGSAPEKQLQLQYQLQRSFGRIMGLGWSQTNDNVFTGTPVPTNNQALNWPIMHPIDILCGPYSYQCLPQPFTLRPDDISSLSQLYFLYAGQQGPGKEPTLMHGEGLYGTVSFPNGQGMEGVNVTVRRREPFYDIPEDWQSVSGVTGYFFRRQGWPPIIPGDGSAMGSVGMVALSTEGIWKIQRIPLPESEDFEDFLVTTEPINPLYTGIYAIGAYNGNTITPSGVSETTVSYFGAAYSDTLVNFNPPDAASSCSPVGDGAEYAPAAVDPSGSWSNLLCGYAHFAWSSLAVKDNRSLTFEVMATDESGFPTMNKLMPLIGAWNSTDGAGTLPTVASITSAFNAPTVATTSLLVRNPSARTLRFAIADQRGAGRPDFTYGARVLYADTIYPTVMPSSGGSVQITGMGFRSGNIVTVNGVVATVTSLTANSITANVPTLQALALNRAAVTNVAVKDLATGGTSEMTSALIYLGPTPGLSLVSSPSGSITVGSTAPVPFSVKMVAANGTTGLGNYPITFTATGGAIRFGGCASSSCVVSTDSSGAASVTVTPTAAGAVTLLANSMYGSVTGSFTAAAVQPDQMRLVSAPTGTLTVGTAATVPFAINIKAADGVTPRVGATVALTSTGSGVLFGSCGSATCTVTTDANGTARAVVTPKVAGAMMLVASNNGNSISAQVVAAAKSVRVVSAPSGITTVGASTPAAFSIRVLAGDGTTPVQGEPVAFSGSNGVILGVCGASTCAVTTDASGMASTSVTPTTAGPMTVTATITSGSASASWTAAQASMRLVSAPSGTVTTGVVLSPAFAVKVISGDGATPLAGSAVVFSATGGAVRFGACGGATCTVMTDATGVALSTVTATAVGTVRISAVGDAGSVAASFAAQPKTIQILSAPSGIATVGTAPTTPFAVKVLLGDGTPSVGDSLVFSTTAGVVQFSACRSASCAMTTDASGVASSAVTPTSAGAIVLSATGTGVSATSAFSAAPETMQILSAPTGTLPVGFVAPAAFIVRVLAGDGLTPRAGEAVTVSATGAGAILSACGASTCQLRTDATGVVSTSLKPTAAGNLAITAMALASTQTVSVSAVNLPDILRLVSAPSGTIFTGDPAATAFAVRVLRPDGVTPVPGAAVVFSMSGGSAWFGACGLDHCSAVTDATGTASTAVTTTGGGSVTLVATAQAGIQTATFASQLRIRSITATRPAQYVAAGASVNWTAAVALTDNAVATAGVPVTWTGSNGLAFATGITAADATGNAIVSVTSVPLSAGVQAQGQACAWNGICTTIAAQGVSASEWGVQVVSGGGQTVTVGDALAPVVLRVVDRSGHPVAGVTAGIYQTISAWQPVCADAGRCPVAPVYGSSESQATSDSDGLLRVTPSGSTDGVATVTSIAVVAGTQGYGSVVLEKHP